MAVLSHSEEELKRLNDIIDQAGSLGDNDMNLANTTLAIAALDSPAIKIERYQHHIQTMSDEVALRHAQLIEEGAEDDVGTQLAALKHVIADKYEYAGDEEKLR